MADYRERLAERLIHEREKRSLSQDTLALAAGVSPKTVKRIEERKIDRPRPVTIRRLAEALEVEPDVLRPPDELEEEQLNRIEGKLDREVVSYLRRIDKRQRALQERQAEIQDGIIEILNHIDAGFALLDVPADEQQSDRAGSPGARGSSSRGRSRTGS